MRVLVLGAGVIGVTSAWYLAQRGHEVTVLERQPGVAEETSFANAGMLSYGYANPWAAPWIPFKALLWMLQDLGPIAVHTSGINWNTLRWLYRLLSQCNQRSYRTNKQHLLRLTEHSQRCMTELTKTLPLDFEYRTQGTLELFRDQRKMENIESDLMSLRICGVEHQLLDQNECIDHEPALAHVKDRFVGGLRFPGDATGDCHRFTRALAAACEQCGVSFHHHVTVTGIETVDQQVQAIHTSAGSYAADAYVACLGSYTPLLLKPLGLRLPVQPLKGYSLTVPITDASRAPQSTVMDEKLKVAITRFDNRIRIGGTAEIAYFNKSLNPVRRRPAEHVLNSLFPGAGDLSQAQFWCGLRPMTPDSLPTLGKTPISNLYLNCGHGTLGWTMAVGSAQLLADILGDQCTDIDLEGIDPMRWLSRNKV